MQKASCEIKTRTIYQPQRNGDIYETERQTHYDSIRIYLKQGQNL